MEAAHTTHTVRRTISVAGVHSTSDDPVACGQNPTVERFRTGADRWIHILPIATSSGYILCDTSNILYSI